MRFVCKISLSLLETRENTFGFLFSYRNWRKYLKFLHFFCKSSRSLLEPGNRSRHFSFLFSKLEMWIPYFSFSSWFDFLASRQCLRSSMFYVSIFQLFFSFVSYIYDFVASEALIIVKFVYLHQYFFCLIIFKNGNLRQNWSEIFLQILPEIIILLENGGCGGNLAQISNWHLYMGIAT